MVKRVFHILCRVVGFGDVFWGVVECPWYDGQYWLSLFVSPCGLMAWMYGAIFGLVAERVDAASAPVAAV